MYRRNLGLIAAVLSLSVSVTFGLSMAPTALAQNNPPQNDFGQGATQLAQSPSETNKGAMGEHSSNPPADLSPGPSREGIGNVGEALGCGKLTPDELARVLSGPTANFPDCSLARP